VNHDVEQWQVAKPAVTSAGGIVAAQHWLAARIGARAFADGGNAVDAAVRAAFALTATEPWMSGLGGSGYMVVWLASERRAEVLNFQGTLAGGIDFADYPLDPSVPDSLMGFPGVKDNRHVVGYGSISVPGAVAGLAEAVARHGRLGFDRAVIPAIDLAERGLPVDWHACLMISLAMDELRRDPAASTIYLPDGMPARPDRFLSLGALPSTLRTLADLGPDAFYRGPLAESMAADLERGGSAIRTEDFDAYRVDVHAPLSGTHRGASLHTAGPTSGGPRLLDCLSHVAEALPSPGDEVGPDTYRAYADGLDKAFAAHKARIGRAADGDEAGCTTHLSAVDGEGNMVALTFTLLNRFGSGVVLPGTGILMNNAVSYFDPRPGYPTSMEGNKRINASNMCPTIAERDGTALFAVGASGANYIVPCTTQIAGFMLDHGLSLEAAFHTPRIDASDRGEVRADPAMSQASLTALMEDHAVEVAQQLVFPKLYSCPSGVARDPATALNAGMADKSSPVAAAAAGA